MPATTLEGLKVKARLAQMMDDEDLAWSIVEDFAQMMDDEDLAWSIVEDLAAAR
jgi:hypothetical protein